MFVRLLVFVSAISAICGNPTPGRTSPPKSFTTPNSFNNNGYSQQQYNQPQAQQWNGYNADYNNNEEQQYHHRNNQLQAVNSYQGQNYPQNFGHPPQNPPLYDDYPEHDSGFPMMAPIRRMYHVYEDNVRGFAKRFRNMIYSPFRMMG